MKAQGNRQNHKFCEIAFARVAVEASDCFRPAEVGDNGSRTAE